MFSLEGIPEISVRRRTGLAETQGGEILIAYILSFGPLSAEKVEGDCCRPVDLIRFG